MGSKAPVMSRWHYHANSEKLEKEQVCDVEECVSCIQSESPLHFNQAAFMEQMGLNYKTAF